MSLTAIAIIKTSGQVAVFGAAIVNLVISERIRQFELVRELGTLECKIENCRLLGQDCSVLQKQYKRLVSMKEGGENGCLGTTEETACGE